jgi:hypothetical protein
VSSVSSANSVWDYAVALASFAAGDATRAAPTQRREVCSPAGSQCSHRALGCKQLAQARSNKSQQHTRKSPLPQVTPCQHLRPCASATACLVRSNTCIRHNVHCPPAPQLIHDPCMAPSTLLSRRCHSLHATCKECVAQRSSATHHHHFISEMSAPATGPGWPVSTPTSCGPLPKAGLAQHEAAIIMPFATRKTQRNVPHIFFAPFATDQTFLTFLDELGQLPAARCLASSVPAFRAHVRHVT